MQLGFDLAPARRIRTVAELTEDIRGLLDGLGDVWVSGEISGTKLHTSGHAYFTMKHGDAVLSCVCYRNALRFLKFKPRDGVEVVARGRLDIWAPSGRHQLIVETLEPLGHGALQVAFEELKKRLAAEGLFDAERKRAVPKLPRRIGVVTSAAGAVLQDILQVLERRMPVHVRLYPAQVQGEGSVDQVVRAIQYFASVDWADVVIVARGGGSLEDLWTFNEEAVARAIAACPVPVISAIGHETDFTIADFVADLRAPTPSAAAEMATLPRTQVLDQIEGHERRLLQQMRYRLAAGVRRWHEQGVDRAVMLLRRRLGQAGQSMDEMDMRLREWSRRAMAQRRRGWEQWTTRLRQQDVRLRLAEHRQRRHALSQRLQAAVERRLAEAKAGWLPAEAHLRQLSPLMVLERGYALVQTAEGQLVKSPVDAPPGATVRVRVAEGEFRARVTPTGSSELPS